MGCFSLPNLGLQHVLAHFSSVEMDTQKQGLGKWTVLGTAGHSEDKCHFQFLTAGDLSWLPLASHQEPLAMRVRVALYFACLLKMYPARLNQTLYTETGQGSAETGQDLWRTAMMSAGST